MTHEQAERLIAVLERIAKVLEGPPAEERLAAAYERSKDTLRELQRAYPAQPRLLEDVHGIVVDRPTIPPDRIVG